MKERLQELLDNARITWERCIDGIVSTSDVSRERAEGVLRAIVGLLAVAVLGILAFVAVLIVWKQASTWLLLPAAVVGVDYALIRALSESEDDDDAGSGYA